MARPNREAIETFMSITGVSEATAIEKLEEHGGNLNEAVNAHFGEEERTGVHRSSVADPVVDAMDIDDTNQPETRRPPFSLLPSARNLNPFSLLDPNFTRSILDVGTFTSREPFVSHPREVREIPIEVKDGAEQSGHSGNVPTVEDVTGSADAHGPEIHGTVTIDDDDDDDDGHVSLASVTHGPTGHSRPSAPGVDESPDYSNDIEEEMIRAAIEASKKDTDMPHKPFDFYNEQSTPISHEHRSDLEDPELAHAVSLSLKTAEQEKALREMERALGDPEPESSKLVKEERNLESQNGRLEKGNSSFQEEAEDVEEQPLVRNSRRRISSLVGVGNDVEEIVVSPPANPRGDSSRTQPGGRGFHSDEWGGISSEEHDEAVMLEAAMFGGVPGETGYHFPYAPHQFMQNGVDGAVGPHSRRTPRPPSPSLTAQRLLREQQDDEYLASLQADREKELRAKEESEAALADERRKEKELCRKIEEEQEIERQLAAKEASLPQEPALDDENAVTLLVRMPDGSRRGRRFIKSDKLQHLFDYIDVGRVVKPGTYRVVRPYPRRAFSDGELALTLNELGLTSKQEALFLELI